MDNKEEYEELANEFENGYWNYRILEKESRYTFKEGKKSGKTQVEKYYEIHEVYYNGNDEPIAWSEEPMRIFFQEASDVKSYIKFIKKACEHKILKIEEYTDENGEEHKKLVELNKYMKNIKWKDSSYMLD